jgi:hypothetical protein
MNTYPGLPFQTDREAAMGEADAAETPAKEAVAGAANPSDDAAMRLCERLLERYMRQLWGDPAGDESRAARRPDRSAAARQPAPAVCGARLRDGSPCQRPPVEGRRRCRSHGCAPRTGAPKGNRNALKDGFFTAAELGRRRRINEFLRECRETLKRVDAEMKERTPPDASPDIVARR